MGKYAAIFLLLIPLAACGEEKSADYVGSFAGPYVGPVSVRILRPDGRIEHDAGGGSAQFVKTENGRARLVVVGNIKADGDAGFVVDGTYDAIGWTSFADGVSLKVGRDGEIAGGGAAGSNHLRMKGMVTSTAFDLTVDLRTLKANRRVPAGTRFIFEYRLNSANKRVSQVQEKYREVDARPSKQRDRCKRIVWRARNIAGFGGGPMQMIQVPECVKW